ncbi:hypothetical protein EKO27_g1036 [Xylaria grammica]|uniref:Uncharacterized protein n=1 Tax=Xylaria grammica TaxID=363999 RepID=A0A439DI54_9PEZI|nr:hypothetical protein EKO27_g1036 [Xylaria grammica]
MHFVEAVHDAREIISKLFGVVDTPEGARPAAKGGSLSTVGTFWLLAIAAHLSRPALIAGGRGIIFVAGSLPFACLSATAPGYASIVIGVALIAARVTVVTVTFGGVRRLAGRAPSLGKSHQIRLKGLWCGGLETTG